MSNNLRTRNGLPFNFEDGLKVRDVDIGTYITAPIITNLSTTTTADSVTVESSTGTDAVIPSATTTTAGVMSAADKVKLSGIDLTAKQDTLVSGTNIKTINNASILGSGNINISGGAATATGVTFTPSGGLSSINVQTALVELDSEKQNTLVSGTNIKTINGSSILGSGDIAISGGASDASSVTFAPVGNIASTSVQAAIAELDSEKQTTLVSGTNIKTINGTSLLGDGDISVSGGSSEYYVFGSSSSSAYNAPEQDCIIAGWSLLASSGSSVTTNGTTFDVPAGAWMVSCSIGITLPPNIGIYSKFRIDGTFSVISQITGSATTNATGTTSYATSTGSGIVVTSWPAVMIYVATASGGFNLNSEQDAHKVTFMKI